MHIEPCYSLALNDLKTSPSQTKSSNNMKPHDHISPEPEMIQSLHANGLLDNPEYAQFSALTGGVSSDIWKVETDRQTYCVKRALAKLRVQADWFAPVERNKYEVCWYRFANQYVPGSAPKILAHDERMMLFAMEFLEPSTYKLWKTELLEGRVDPICAGWMGSTLGKIHAKAANDPSVKDLFPPNEIFHAIRLEPYLEATALKHPDLKDTLFSLSKRTRETSLTLIHGDVSPKNILLGPKGVVILDAECACLGDPAFDLAFCLNHFLLKCIWDPTNRGALLSCFEAMVVSYLDQITWEDPNHLEFRTATLLPGLFLARVDGKSPVEYITKEVDKNKIRRCARSLLSNPASKLIDVAQAWKKEL